MTAPYMGGLLDQGQTPFDPMMPNGLLQFLQQNPGNRMAQNMAATAQSQSQSQSQQQSQQQAAPEMPAAPQQMAPPQQGPSDAGRALMDAGSAAMQAATPRGGGSLGAALGAALDVGSRSFTARKDARADAETQAARVDAYRQTVMKLDLPPDAKAGLLHMGVEEGAKLLATNNIKVPEAKVVAKGGALVSNSGEQLYTNDPGMEPDSNVQSIMAAKYPGKTLAELSPEQRAKVLADAGEYRRTGAANISSSSSSSPVVNAATTKFGQEVIPMMLERKKEFIKTVDAELGEIDRMQGLITDGGIMTGLFAEGRAKIAALAGDTKAQNTLEFLQRVKRRVLPIARTLAPVTKEDIDMLESIKGGQLYLTPARINRLLELDKLAVEHSVGVYNRDVLSSAIMGDAELKPYAGDALHRLGDGRLLVARTGRDRDGKALGGTDEVQYAPGIGKYMVMVVVNGEERWKEYK